MAAADPEGQAGTYVYDLGVRAGLVMRELVPELHTQGPQKCYRERANDDVTGWTIWAAATLLARWVAAHPAVFAGRDVIELGAGCGLTGLAAACCTPARSVVLSDYMRETAENLLWNAARNCARDARAPPLPPAPATVGDGGVVTTAVGDSLVSAGDTFISRTGCRVTLSRNDWDEPDTWPRREAGAPAGEAGADAGAAAAEAAAPGFAQYDIILCADLFYRRSYSRKVAAAVRAMLRPGGVVLVATPTAREGLQTLDSMMAAAGFVAAEEAFPAEWRVSPLRPPAPPLGGLLDDLGLSRLGLAPVDGAAEALEAQLLAASAAAAGGGAGVGEEEAADDAGVPAGRGVDDAVVLPLRCARTGAPSTPLHFVGAEAARGMFPELFQPSYAIVRIAYTRNAAAAAEGDGGGAEPAAGDDALG